jgi:hypothetical protein
LPALQHAPAEPVAEQEESDVQQSVLDSQQSQVHAAHEQEPVEQQQEPSSQQTLQLQSVAIAWFAMTSDFGVAPRKFAAPAIAATKPQRATNANVG